jgi:heat shock protein 5
VQDDGYMAGKIGDEDREQMMEAALAEALEWMEERDGVTRQTVEEDYEEKLREMEEVCGQSSSRWGSKDGSVAQDGRAAWCGISTSARCRIGF